MEFNEKLQGLRKQKGITQQELAEALYVSRTAVSKWESGRGYPSIDSLREISKFFSVTIDELLSGTEALNIAEEDNKQKENRFRRFVFGLLDLSCVLLFLLPFFGQESEGIIEAVPLLSLNGSSHYLTVLYSFMVSVVALYGLLMLIFQNCKRLFFERYTDKVSLVLSAFTALLLIISSQPYAATFLFVLMIIKVSMLIKR